MSSAASTSSKSFVIAAKYCCGRFSGNAIFQIILSVISRKATESNNEENERMKQKRLGLGMKNFFVFILTHYGGPRVGHNVSFRMDKQ